MEEPDPQFAFVSPDGVRNSLLGEEQKLYAAVMLNWADG